MSPSLSGKGQRREERAQKFRNWRGRRRNVPQTCSVSPTRPSCMVRQVAGSMGRKALVAKQPRERKSRLQHAAFLAEEWSGAMQPRKNALADTRIVLCDGGGFESEPLVNALLVGQIETSWQRHDLWSQRGYNWASFPACTQRRRPSTAAVILPRRTSAPSSEEARARSAVLRSGRGQTGRGERPAAGTEAKCGVSAHRAPAAASLAGNRRASGGSSDVDNNAGEGSQQPESDRRQRAQMLRRRRPGRTISAAAAASLGHRPDHARGRLAPRRHACWTTADRCTGGARASEVTVHREGAPNAGR